jgi:hypothetical protein
MVFRNLRERFIKTVLNLYGCLAGLVIIFLVTFKPCHAQTGFNCDIQPRNEAAWLKGQIALDEFQYGQIEKIEIEYHKRILYSFQEYASDKDRKRMALHIAMAFVDHQERIRDLLGKKQKKRWSDIITKKREATRRRLMKYQDDGTGFNK